MKQHYLKTCGGIVLRWHFRRVFGFFSSGYWWQSKDYPHCCKYPSTAYTIEATQQTTYADKYIRNHNYPKRKQICSFVAVVRQWILISVLNFWVIGKYPNIAFRYKKIIKIFYPILEKMSLMVIKMLMVYRNLPFPMRGSNLSSHTIFRALQKLDKCFSKIP